MDKGALKIWWIPQVPMAAFEVGVADLEQASLLLSVLADYDAFQYKHNVKPDYCNIGGLVVFEDGDWFDWYDDDGRDFDEVRRDPALLAQAIEARRAATGTGPVHESAVAEGHAPEGEQP